MPFWNGYVAQLGGHVSGKEGGIQVLFGLSSIKPNSTMPFYNPLTSKARQCSEKSVACIINILRS